MRKALKELAEKENIPKWHSAIAQWIEQTTPGAENFAMEITASFRYAHSGSLAWITTFLYTASVGWHRKVLLGSAGFLDWKLEIRLNQEPV